MLTAIERHRQHDTQQAAVERHTPLPESEDLQRVAEVITSFVKQHVAKATTEHNTERTIKEQIVDGLIGPALLRQTPCMNPPHHDEQHERQQIHQTVPVDGQWPDANRHGIELRMDQRGHGYLSIWFWVDHKDPAQFGCIPRKSCCGDRITKL